MDERSNLDPIITCNSFGSALIIEMASERELEFQKVLRLVYKLVSLKIIL